jgi:hypothetical protein
MPHSYLSYGIWRAVQIMKVPFIQFFSSSLCQFLSQGQVSLSILLSNTFSHCSPLSESEGVDGRMVYCGRVWIGVMYLRI